jgi:hypothetical protein
MAVKTCIKVRTTHGGKGTRLYRVWKNMRQRCGNPNNTDWMSYGGRGIRICERWSSFQNFSDDLGAPYAEHVANHGAQNTSIDRIDTDGHYEPSNCRWATAVKQARNRRTVRKIEFRGKSQTLPEWAEELGIGRDTLKTRLQDGWTVERAFTEPVIASCVRYGKKYRAQTSPGDSGFDPVVGVGCDQR